MRAADPRCALAAGVAAAYGALLPFSTFPLRQWRAEAGLLTSWTIAGMPGRNKHCSGILVSISPPSFHREIASVLRVANPPLFSPSKLYGEYPGAVFQMTPLAGMYRAPDRPSWSECASIVAPGKLEVVAAWLDLDDEAVIQEVECLSEDERQRASRFRFPRDRGRFIVARARLRQLLGGLLDVHPASIELQYGRRGKPELAMRHAASGLKFNVSHSEDLAVYAFTSDTCVGVDVEAVRPLADADEIAARFFSRRETEAYLALDPRDRPLGFFNCWTRKEAFIKALGEGLHYPLDAFDVSLAPGEPARILRVGELDGDRCGWQLGGFTPAPGFVAAVATQCVPRDAITSPGLRANGAEVNIQC